MKKVAVLGSTGSIGTQTLDVIARRSDLFTVHSLVAHSNDKRLQEQCEKFRPQYSQLLTVDSDAMIKAVKGADIVMVATRGISALKAVLYCLDNGIDIALANKETLICAGKLIKERLAVSKAHLYPVDSEHCAIWECLNGQKPASLVLTASGGAFYNIPAEQLDKMKSVDALRHPNWNMGSKITIDSATLMNKAFEVLEASVLFDVPLCDIEVVVHRQSVVHSMVRYPDGSIIAQMAVPDMRLPILYALTGGHHVEGCVSQLSFDKMLSLTFERPDMEKFPCLKLPAYIDGKGDLMPTVLCAADEVCVEAYMNGDIVFGDFYKIISKAVEYFSGILPPVQTVSDIEETDKKVRLYTKSLIYEVL